MKVWRVFEEAVAAFAQALSPEAVVKHDVKLPDRHTGRPRQRDVWIETSFGGHFRISILVSCKHKKAKLNQQDVDAFAGELMSSSAQKGVLYASSGFTKGALEKAERLGISCCVLLDNQPAPIPVVLSFPSFCFNERYRLRLLGNTKPNGLATVAELLEMYDGSGRRPVDALIEGYEKFCSSQTFSSLVLADLPVGNIGVDISHPKLGAPLRLILATEWQGYQARTNAFLVSGSYSFTDKDFKGSVATPSVDMRSLHPGPGWELIDPSEPPASAGLSTAFIRRPPMSAELLLEAFGPMSFERDFRPEQVTAP